MGRVYVTDTYLTNIANAIRSKNGSAVTYYPSEMAAAINNIPTGFECNIVDNLTAPYQGVVTWLSKDFVKDTNNNISLDSNICLNVMLTKKEVSGYIVEMDTPIVTVDNVTLAGSSHPLSMADRPIYGYPITNYAGKTITISGDGSGSANPVTSFTLPNIQAYGKNAGGYPDFNGNIIQSAYLTYKYANNPSFGNVQSQGYFGTIGAWDNQQSKTVEETCCLCFSNNQNPNQAGSQADKTYDRWVNHINEILNIGSTLTDFVIEGIHTIQLSKNSFYDSTLTDDENYWRMCKHLHDGPFNNTSAQGYYY